MQNHVVVDLIHVSFMAHSKHHTCPSRFVAMEILLIEWFGINFEKKDWYVRTLLNPAIGLLCKTKKVVYMHVGYFDLQLYGSVVSECMGI